MQPLTCYSKTLLLLLVGLLWACKQTAPVRMPCESSYVNIPQDTSYLSTPLVIPTQLIEDKLNRLISREIRDDFEKSDKQGTRELLKMKITRLGDIQVNWKDNIASYQAPLLILIEREIVGKRVIALPKALAVKTKFSLRLVFETTMDIGEDWKLLPQTRFAAFEWLSDVKIMGGMIDVKKMVERRLYQQMPQILEKVDETIRSNVHLDRTIRRIWIKIQKPIRVNRREAQVWLKFNPIRFELGKISTDAGNLMIQTRLSAVTQTLMGDSPAYSVDSILPPLLKRRTLPDEAYVYMLSEISYSDINEIMAERLSGKVLEIADHKIKIRSAEVWGCGAELVLHLQVQGGLKGDIYFRGTPEYEPDSQRIVIKKFDFELQSQELLVASADWLLHDTFKEQMKSMLSIPLLEKIDKIPEAIMTGIERGKVGDKMDFIIREWEFKPQKIWVQPNEIATLVIVNAKVRVVLEQLGR